MRTLLTVLVIACATACSTRDTVATSASVDGGLDDRNGYCEGTGPPVLVGDGTGETDICAGTLAETTFRFGVCACDGFSGSGDLLIDSFDSRDGPYETGEAGGSLGVNGSVDSNAAIDVSGDVVAAGAIGVLAGPVLHVGGDLLDNGPLGRAGTAATIDGDARVNGDITLASLTVAGTLTYPADATLDVTGASDIGAVDRAPVSVDPPCECDPSALLDVAGYVEAHRFANHNADIDLDTDALNGFAGDRTLELPCGLFFLTRIEGDGVLTIRVAGRTALFVAEQISLDAGLVVEVTDGSELDLFVSSHVNVGGVLQMGSASTPARARFYVGGTGSLNVSAAGVFGGNLYAPLVDLALSGGAELHGSAFVNRAVSSGPLDVHYDRAVLDAAVQCPEP